MDKWIPQPKQELFLTLPWYEALFGGAKGPGKTDALLAEGTRQIPIDGYKGIIFRRTMPKLAELIDRSHKWFSRVASWNGEKHRWTWPNRAFLGFGSCKDEKDKYNYQGHEYHYIGFDQIEEFTLSQYLFLMAQNRSTDPRIKCYIRATANPGNVGHAWVKDRFIDRLPIDGTPKYFKKVNDEDIETTPDDPAALSRAFVFATVDDNRILTKNNPNYLKILEMLPEADLKALRYGDWDAFSGQFFREWSKSVHITEFSRIAGPTSRFIALDYGYTNPSSVGWYAVMTDGLIVRYRELYGEGYTYEDLGRLILEMSPAEERYDYLVADPAIWGDRSHHLSAPKKQNEEVKGESGADTLQRILGSRTTVIRGDNSRLIGWGRVREYLKPYIDQHNYLTAKFLVTSNCRQLIRTIPGLIHDTVNVEDVDSSGEDHAADELRYALMSRPRIPDAIVLPPTRKEEFWNRVKKDLSRHKELTSSEEGIRQIGEEQTHVV